ncbi:MAG: WecB/TagA/CpsF family glycosyltransferase [Pseudomonadota bacterium]
MSVSASMIRILGVPVHSISMADAVEAVVERAHGPELSQFAFVNAHCLNIAVENEDYRAVLERAPWVFPDGSGVRYASKMVGTPVLENVNGTDMFPILCARLADEGISVFLLGGEPDVNEKVVNKVRARHPKLHIAGAHHGFFADDREVVHEIASSEADVLLVAMGVPEQEIWIDRYKDELGVNAAIGVGGLFDFVAEKFERAPSFVRRLGFEWLYRLSQDPKSKWRRYVLGNPVFLWRACRWAMSEVAR